MTTVEANPRRPTPFHFSDPRKQGIHERLRRLVGPGPAAFWKDACAIVGSEASPSLESVAHLTGHLFREIESALRDVLSVAPNDPASTSTAKPADKRKDEIKAILAAWGVSADEPWAQAWLRLNLHRAAHRAALDRPRPIDSEFRQLWDDLEAVLDIVLKKFEAQYLTVFERLDALLTHAEPSSEDLKVLKEEIPQSFAARRYFFDRLNDPAWLAPLAKRGFFKNPPPPEWDPDDNSISYPRWPETGYLTRMAALVPDIAQRIALEIPDTENIRVHEDLADVACALPAKLAAVVAPRVKTWLTAPHQLLLPDKLAVLTLHLTKGGQGEAALDLARSLLEVIPDPRAAREPVPSEGYRQLPEPRGRFQSHEYAEILSQLVPPLAAVAGDAAVDLLSDLLENAILLSRRPDERGPEDYSHIWRPAVEDHPQNLNLGLPRLLVSAVRDAAETVAKRDPARVPAMVERLEARPWTVFRRIALHLLRMFPDSAGDFIVTRLTDRAAFDHPGLWHEYSLLARAQFRQLPPAAQATILEWIERGPAVDEDARAHLRERTGKAPTDDDIREYADHWRLRRLAALSDVLPPIWQKRYEALTARLGQPEHPDFVSYRSGVYIGPTSPTSTDSLRAMRLEELVRYLHEWQPTGEMFSPSPEGLGRSLTEIVAANPERFASDAMRFAGLDPTYVRAVIFGLAQAAGGGANRVFPWPPVLDLCRWVLGQPREIPGRDRGNGMMDPGWVWTRKEIARLLERGFEEGPAEIPPELRERAWEILKPLTDDPQPTLDDEAPRDGTTPDPPTMSVNTIRGQAMHAVVQYGLWIRRHIDRAADAKERAARGFDEMPEIRHVLESHLDPEKEPALAIRSVYGRWFPWFALLDFEWARRHVSAIFSPDGPRPALGSTAWDSYITFCPAYDAVLDLLREEYRRAVMRLDPGRSRRAQPHTPEAALVEHLMSLYEGGRFDLDARDDPLALFYQRAGDDLRAYGCEFVGRDLYNVEGPVRPAVLERLQALWARRLAAAQASASPAAYGSEVAAFGWWFASGKFDDHWSIEQLATALRLTGKVDPDHIVVQRLATLSPTMPREAIQCLDLIVGGDKEGWRVQGWTKEMRTILESALGSVDDQARRSATDLINRLGSWGNLEFRDLLH